MLEAACEQHPNSSSPANQLALVLIASEDKQQRLRALETAEKTTAKTPGNPEAWATLGWVQLELGKVDEAQQSLTKVLKAGKLSRDAAFYLAELHRRRGNFSKALEFYSAAKNANGPFFYSHRLPNGQ